MVRYNMLHTYLARDRKTNGRPTSQPASPPPSLRRHPPAFHPLEQQAEEKFHHARGGAAAACRRSLGFIIPIPSTAPEVGGRFIRRREGEEACG
jgi:hypothetical protein